MIFQSGFKFKRLFLWGFDSSHTLRLDTNFKPVYPYKYVVLSIYFLKVMLVNGKTQAILNIFWKYILVEQFLSISDKEKNLQVVASQRKKKQDD